MADRRALIREAIERLPLSEGAGSADQAAFALEMTCYFARVNELPRMQTSRKKNGMNKELNEFAKRATRLCQQIEQMHRQAQNALSPKGERHVLAVQSDLEVMIRRAFEAAEASPETESTPSNHRLAPKQIAQACAQMFSDLTGKRPTLHYDPIEEKRTGAFLGFVTDIFQACEIDASAEHYARDAEKAGDVIGGNGGVTMRRVPAKK